MDDKFKFDDFDRERSYDEIIDTALKKREIIDSINQNSLEYGQNLSQGEENANNTRTESGISGLGDTTHQTPKTQGNGSLPENKSNNAEQTQRNPTISASASRNSSTPREYERGGNDAQQRDKNESRSAAESEESQAVGYGTKEISRRGRAESEESEARSERSQAMVSGSQIIAEIYTHKVKFNEQDIKKAKALVAYLETKCQSNEGRISVQEYCNKATKNTINQFKDKYSIAKPHFKAQIYTDYTKKLLSMQFLCDKLEITIEPEYKQEIDKLYTNQKTKFHFR